MEFLDSFSAYWSQMPFLVLSCNFLAQVTSIKGLVNTSYTQQEITRGKSVWPENLVSCFPLSAESVSSNASLTCQQRGGRGEV